MGHPARWPRAQPARFGTLTGRSTRDNGLGGIKTFADGMTIDNEGRLCVATGGGVEVLSEQGQHLGTIPVRCPPADCQNLAFAGSKDDVVYRRRRIALQSGNHRPRIHRPGKVKIVWIPVRV